MSSEASCSKLVQPAFSACTEYVQVSTMETRDANDSLCAEIWSGGPTSDDVG